MSVIPPDLKDRVARLERLVCVLADALLRRGTDQDGGYGFPSCNEEMRAILAELGFDFGNTYRPGDEKENGQNEA